MSKVSKHFTDKELMSPMLIKMAKERNVPISWYILNIWIEALEDVRIHFGKPVYVNKGINLRRGICTEQECIDAKRKFVLANGEIVSLSQHCRNGAFDITVKGISAFEVGLYIHTIADKYGIGGLGIDSKRNFVHFDFRNSKEMVEWKYTA